MLPLWILSHTKKQSTSICFMCSWKTELAAICSGAWLSQLSCISFKCETPRHNNNALNHFNSDSNRRCDTVCCFLDFQESANFFTIQTIMQDTSELRDNSGVWITPSIKSQVKNKLAIKSLVLVDTSNNIPWVTLPPNVPHMVVAWAEPTSAHKSETCYLRAYKAH